MKKNTMKTIGQLNNILNGNYDGENKDLIMSIFMQIFAYKFDNKISSKVKFRDIQSITDKTWKPLDKKTNALVGIPTFTMSEEKNGFDLLDLNSKTEYILNKIRGSIVHGSFAINNDGTISITDNGFQMVFEFDCIVDICTIIMEELAITDENEIHLYDFLQFIKNIKNTPPDYNKSKIDFSFCDLKYPIILFNLLPMNEDDFHNDPEYASFITKLFSSKDFYKNGNLKDDTPLRTNELYKLRNCIAHAQYYISRDELILFDHNEAFVFNCTKLDELFGLNGDNALTLSA